MDENPWEFMARGFFPPKTTGDALFERAAPTCEKCCQPMMRAEMTSRTLTGGLFGPYARLVCPEGHVRRVAPF